jgi:hypothetical protein
MKLAWPENWKLPISGAVNLQTNDSGALIYEYVSGTTQKLDCSKYFMVDPFDSAGTHDPFPEGMSDASGRHKHIYKVGVDFDNKPLWQDRMTGQDDLVYTTHSDKRTDFSGQGDKILSSGQYTWFFMFQPRVRLSDLSTLPNLISWSGILVDADIDILGCYNRVPGAEQSVKIISNVPYNNNCISVKISSGDYDFKNTKYVFLSWWDTSANNHAIGGWYKVINATETMNSTRDIFLMFESGTSYPDPISGSEICLQMLIVPGLLYHKRIGDIRDQSDGTSSVDGIKIK